LSFAKGNGAELLLKQLARYLRRPLRTSLLTLA
jgi:hypothetical protein